LIKKKKKKFLSHQVVHINKNKLNPGASMKNLQKFIIQKFKESKLVKETIRRLWDSRFFSDLFHVMVIIIIILIINTILLIINQIIFLIIKTVIILIVKIIFLIMKTVIIFIIKIIFLIMKIIMIFIKKAILLIVNVIKYLFENGFKFL